MEKDRGETSSVPRVSVRILAAPWFRLALYRPSNLGRWAGSIPAEPLAQDPETQE